MPRVRGKKGSAVFLSSIINNEKIVTWSDRWNSIKSALFPSQAPEKKITLPKKQLTTKIGPVTFSKDSSFASAFMQ